MYKISIIWSLAYSSVIPLSRTNYKHFYDQNAYPESVFCTSVCEVYHQLKRFVIERFQSQQHMVDQEISINLSHPTMRKKQKWQLVKFK